VNQESRMLQNLEHTTFCERGAIGIPKQVMELIGLASLEESLDSKKEDKAIALS
jgi:hypothetical protein